MTVLCDVLGGRGGPCAKGAEHGADSAAAGTRKPAVPSEDVTAGF